MKASDLREKGLDELSQEKLALLREQFNLRMQRATGQFDKPHLFKMVRRNLARVEMVIDEKSKADKA